MSFLLTRCEDTHFFRNFAVVMTDNASAIFEGLNSEQKNAVSSVDGPVLIVAGAGSGKTRVLTSRIAYLIEKGCDPSRILSLTFTKKAAGEMKERIALMVGQHNARKICMGTFHSVFIRFLRDYAEVLKYPKDFTIYDQNDSTTMIKHIIKEMGMDEKIYKPKDVLSRISEAKNKMVTPAKYAASANAIAKDTQRKMPRIVDIYNHYWQRCRATGVMDFDDILMNMVILFHEDPNALEEISSRFDYLLVDEYQDTNNVQYRILMKLCQRHHNICVVGDESQSIYAFRGADISNILNFSKDFPGAKLFRLERNYRSTSVIVDASNSLIEKNSGRIPKKCYSVGEQGDKIRLVQAYNEKDESSQIVSEIVRRIGKDKAQYKDFAILYRVNNQSRSLEEQLRLRNIPYKIYSGHSFFDRQEVKDLMAYFKLVTNIRDDEAFRRAVAKPSRGIGETTIAALTAAARAQGMSLFKSVYSEGLEAYGLKQAGIAKLRQFCDMVNSLAMALPVTDAYEFAKRVALESGIYGMYKEYLSIEGQARVGNLDELLNSIKTFVEERYNERYEERLAQGEEIEEINEASLGTVTLSEFMENIALIATVDMEEGDDSDNKVSLMTVHTSKGLEFPYVFVCGMEENLFPSGGMLISPSEVEEERRLFYVAITRAKKALWLSFATQRMRNGKSETNSVSRFIRNIDRSFIENPLPDGTTAREDAVHKESSFVRMGGNPGAVKGRSAQFQPKGTVQYGRSSAPVPVRKVGVPSRPAPQRIPDSEFVPSPVHLLKAGQRVEHNRFGFGKMIEISGPATDLKALIDFDEYGEKTLILKYAKIRIVD